MEAVRNPSVSYRYSFDQDNFNKIPGNPIAYWVSADFIDIYSKSEPLSKVSVACVGLQTSDNNRFVRLWHEVDIRKVGFGMNSLDDANVSKKKWFPYNKGGGYRKWYGNQDYIVNWENNGEEIKEYNAYLNSSRSSNIGIANTQYYFRESGSWGLVTSNHFSVRYSPNGFIFDTGGSSVFANHNLKNIIALLNSKISTLCLQIQNPTLNFQPGNVSRIPYVDAINNTLISDLASNSINISKLDWDSFEVSWNFKKHPFLNGGTVRLAFENWKKECEERFKQLKHNEEELNSLFIDIYGLQNDLTPDVAEKDVMIRKAELEKDIKSFISYAIGCSFGRYSLNEEGLVYAGGEFDASRYQTFPADEDNILPILSGAYFEDDIVTRFVDFVRVTYSEETLEENLDFIADAIGRKANETAREALRRYFLNDFYKDHVQVYKKRPIYWLFTSGKEKAFNCLIYMHRYDKTTLSRIRTDYLHEVQIRMDAEKKDLLTIIEGDYTAKEISNAKKELKALDKKIDELKAYDEILHHMADMQIEIDLDDGVKVNYEKFKGLVAKI